MPRITKDNIIEDLDISVPKKSEKKAVEKGTKKATKSSTTKKNTKNSPTKKATTKTTASKNSTTKSTTKKTATKNSEAKSTSNKKSASSTKRNSTTKKTTAKKVTTQKVAAKKVVSKKVSNKKVVEYYDLPNQYEQTIVKILAQTPTVLFVYWNISDKDTKKLLKQYGENFFQNTYPVLLIINKTKNYQFEVEINDYANSWYLHIPDSDCKYEVILIRKNKNFELQNQTISITSSNQIDTPNDHILFEKLGKTVFFQNVKNSNIQEKDISSFVLMHHIGRIYNIYDLYKEIYKDELNGDELGMELSSSQSFN